MLLRVRSRNSGVLAHFIVLLKNSHIISLADTFLLDLRAASTQAHARPSVAHAPDGNEDNL